MAKGIFRGVGKIFESNFGRQLLTAAVVYVGGAAMGMWKSPFESVNGSLAGNENAAAPPPPTEATAQFSAETATTQTPEAAAAPTNIDTAAQLSAANNPTNTQQVANKGIIPRASGEKSWFQDMSPEAQYGLIAAGAGAVQGAFTPNSIDVEREKAKLARENMEWRSRFLSPNFDVGSINVGQPAPQQPAVQRRGFINNVRGT